VLWVCLLYVCVCARSYVLCDSLSLSVSPFRSCCCCCSLALLLSLSYTRVRCLSMARALLLALLSLMLFLLSLCSLVRARSLTQTSSCSPSPSPPPSPAPPVSSFHADSPSCTVSIAHTRIHTQHMHHARTHHAHTNLHFATALSRSTTDEMVDYYIRSILLEIDPHTSRFPHRLVAPAAALRFQRQSSRPLAGSMKVLVATLVEDDR